MTNSTNKLIKYGSKSFFVLFVGFATLLGVQYISEYFAPEPFVIGEIPEHLELKSEPQDVLYAEAYINPQGEEELKYAYADDEAEDEDWEDVTRRTPNSRTEVIDVRQEGDEKIETLRTAFYTKPQFYEIGGDWRQIEYATTTPEVFADSGAIKYVQRREWWERILPGKPVFADVSTFRPQPNVETVSVDGQIQFSDLSGGYTANDSGTTWTTGTVSFFDNIDCFCYVYFTTRGFALFDTSALGATANISAAELSLYASGKTNGDNDGNDVVRTFSSSPISNTALEDINSADYNSVGITNYVSSPPDITSISTSAFTDMTLNASGIANISKTGISKFGFKEGHDGGAGLCNGCTSSVNWRSAETSLTTQDPHLEVTFTVSSFSFGQWFPF